jgi:hypothetical protein
MPAVGRFTAKLCDIPAKFFEKYCKEELFTKKKYQWTGTTSLGAYLVSATSSHYDWGLKTIKPLKKLVKN